MATTKTLLEAAVLKMGAAASAPNTSSGVGITLDSVSTNTYTPANDGYIRVYAERNSSVGSSQPTKVAVETTTGAFVAPSISASTWYGLDALMPVHKGVEVRIIGYAAKTLRAWFFRLVGGGKNLCNQLLKRGALWPRLRQCSIRSPKRVANGHSLKGTKSQSEQCRLTPTMRLRGLTNLSTSLLAMELFGPTTLMSRLRTSMARVQERKQKTEVRFPAGFGHLFAKGKPQRLRALTRPLPRLCTFCLCSVKPSLSFCGGVA